MKQSKHGRHVLRLLAGVVLALALTGPAPGNVGGCGVEAPFADPVDHCIDAEYYACWHEAAGGRLSEAQFQECLVPIRARCEPRTWPADCAPLRGETDECIVHLTREDLWMTPVDQLLAQDGNPCDLCP